MFDLRSFGLSDLLELSSALRRRGEDASSMEGAARAIVDYLYGTLIDKETDEPALALVRLYKTHRFDELEPELQAFATATSPGRPVAPEAPCLTLLATAGCEPAWNDRRRSRGHQAIPLRDAAAMAGLPMVYQLTRQIGLDEGDVVRPHPNLFKTRGGRPGGVFYVPDAVGSEYVPAQRDFVEPFGIRSVLGFGGVLPSGYVYAVVMFARVTVPPEAAEAFTSLTFATQLALLPFVEGRLFDSDRSERAPNLERDLRRARAEAVALGHLLDTRQHIVTEQAARLEQARQDAEDRAEALARSQRRLERSEATKAAILEAALDAIITMDGDGRIVDFNRAAERTFGYPREQAVGQILADLLVPPGLRDAHRAGLARYRRTGQGPILGQRIEISALRSDGTEFPVELAVAPVNAGGTSLFSGHIRDITDRVQAERELRAAGERYAEIARILQSSLLPRELPVIPGFDVASTYRPGQEGLDVGGDFYDVFEVSGGCWAVVLGDVMGKGAEAAATTALARHTVRAAAIATADPRRVLQLLNEALHRDNPERFCTAAFAFAETGPRPGLALSSGGHPSPLLRRSSRVAPLEAPGTLLGPFSGWEGETLSVELQPGDLVLLYSDGVTEARRGREQFGVDRLAAVLRATADESAAATVDSVVDALISFNPTASDDIAIVALRVTGEKTAAGARAAVHNDQSTGLSGR